MNQIDKKVIKICKSEQSHNRCGDSCILFSKCIIKNIGARDQHESLIDYIKDLNAYSVNISNI